MRFSKKAILGWMGVILFAGLACTLQALHIHSLPRELKGTQWELESFGQHGSESSVVQGTRLVMVFSARDRMGGTDGCNTFEAGYETRLGRLRFQDLTGTRTACADRSLLDQERLYLKALEEAGRYELIDDRLIIWYGDGRNTLIFRRSQPPGLVGSLLDKG